MHMFLCVLLTMLDQQKPRGSQQQGAVDRKASRINNRNHNLKNNHMSNRRNTINPAHCFSLQSELCATSPALASLPSPLLGGLTGNSLLIPQQAASLHLAQLKTQLALTQINSALAVNSRTADFKVKTTTHIPYVHSTPRSPTAAAINLLNLLKIANSMSHPHYNPCSSGNQSSVQRQYGHSNTQAEIGLKTAISHLEPGSSFSSSASPAIPENRRVIPLMPLSFRPEERRTFIDENIEGSVDMHFTRAREEVSIPGTQMQHTDCSALFSSIKRDDFHSQGTEMTSSTVSSPSGTLGHRGSDGKSGGSSMDLLNYKRSTCENSSASFTIGSSGTDRFNVQSGKGHNVQYIPGLSVSTQRKYTSESATDILLQYGLDDEDLEYLISYPEDQITPGNLKKILHQRSIEKTKRTTAVCQTKSYSESINVSGQHSHTLSTSGAAGMNQKGILSAALQPTKVIDYGHTGRYIGGVMDEVGRTSDSTPNRGGSGSVLLLDPYDDNGKRQELLQKHIETKSALGSSSKQTSSGASQNSSYRSVLNLVAPSSQSVQTKKTAPSSLSLLKKETNMSVPKCKTSKPVPLKEPKADHKSPPKPKPSCSMLRGMHPGRPGLVLISSNENSSMKNKKDAESKVSAAAERVTKQVQQSSQQVPQMLKDPVLQMGHAMLPAFFSAPKQLPSVPVTSTGTDASRTVHHPVYMPPQIISPPSLLQPVPDLMSINKLRQPTGKVAVFKDLPTSVMMHDYAAASPRIFPHTCSLCNKDCTHMKDWLSHQNTSHHLENCRRLRQQYPDWDGAITLKPRLPPGDLDYCFDNLLQSKHSQQTQSMMRPVGKYAKPSSSPAETSQHRGSHSRSHSPSPHRRYGLNGRREKRSRSRSPQNSRHVYRSPETLLSPRQSDDNPRRINERRSSSKRIHERASSPQRNKKRELSPRLSKKRRLPPHRSEGRQSPPRRNDERQLPPRSDERHRDKKRSPPRRTDERQLPPRSDERHRDKKRSPPRRTDDKPLLPRRSQERRLPTEATSRLEKTGVKSSQSDLDAVVKNLASALVAEIKKMNSASSSSASSSSKGGKHLSSPTTTAGRRSSISASLSSYSPMVKKAVSSLFKSKPILQKSGEGSSKKMKFGKSSPPTMVKLDRIPNTLSHNDISTALEKFGKTKSLVLFRKKLQAIVCFEKEEDARKLKSVKCLHVKGVGVTIVRDKGTVSKVPKMSPQNKSSLSSTSASKTTKSTVTTATSKVAMKPHRKVLSVSDKETTGKYSIKTVSLKRVKTATKRKVLVSKAKNTSTKLTAKSVKTNLAVKEAKKKVVVKKKISKGSKTAAPGKPQLGHSVQTPKSEKSTTGYEESVKVVKKRVGVNIPMDTGANNDKEIVTEGLRSRAEAASTEQTSTSSLDNLSVAGPAMKEEVEDSVVSDQYQIVQSEPKPMPEKCDAIDKESAIGGAQEPISPLGISVNSKLTTSNNESNEENSKPKESETKVQENVALLEDKAGVVEPKPQPKHDKAPDAEDTEQMQFGKAELESMEPMEVRSYADDKVPTTMGAVLENDSVEALQCMKQNILPAPTVAQTVEAESVASQIQQQVSGCPGEAAVEAKVPGGELEESTKQDATPLKTQSNSAPGKDSSVMSIPTTAEESKQKITGWKLFRSDCLPLTAGEVIQRHLKPKKLCLQNEYGNISTLLPSDKKVVLISKLPWYYDGCYTEKDLAELLKPFGFQYNDDNIYVLPQAHKAFALMQVEKLHRLISGRRWIFLRTSRLFFGVVTVEFLISPLGFYKSLMNHIHYSVFNDGSKIVYVKNISPNQTRALCNTWKENSRVSNILPLLNKVFIEFSCEEDADRFGVWCCLQKEALGHEVHRLKEPSEAQSEREEVTVSRHPRNVLQDKEDVVAGITIPPLVYEAPHGSTAPFWITMRSSPFVFPTVCPWFVIPDYLTINGLEEIEEASSRGTTFATVMLTSLPEGKYTHENVAKLVWPYFPKQNLHTLYYNVIVLPLQRRAFVSFSDWAVCCSFVRDHITKPVAVNGCKLSVHFVFQHLMPEFNEEVMYTSLMKWSDAGVFYGAPEPESLNERLLCVETAEASVDIVRMVMEVVSSIATFVSFLPLANRICIEMSDSSGVEKVLEKYSTFSPSSPEKELIWRSVERFETLESLKKRLQDSSEITINLDDAVGDNTKPPQIKQDVLKGITVTIYQDINTTGTQSQEEEDQIDFTEDTLPDNFVSDEQNFNMDDFVTVDEVGSDVEDPPLEPEHSSSTPRRERQCSNISCKSKQISRPSNGSKSSPAWWSSRSEKDSSNLSSISPKKDSREFPEPNKHTTRYTSSPKGSNPSLTESSSLLGQKTQQNKAKSQSKKTNMTSSSISTHCSSKTTVQAARETHPQQLREENTDAEGAVAKSDHREAAEDTAAKTVESETAMETSSVTDGTLKEKESKGGGQKDDAEQHEEEEDDCGNYQILDSLDDQTDEQMDDVEQYSSSLTQLAGPDEAFQVCVGDEGQTHTENSNMAVGVSLTELSRVPEDQTASGRENVQLQDGSSPVNLLPETKCESENKEKRTKKERSSQTNDGPSKRSEPSTTASESEKEKSPTKQDKTVKKYETRRRSNISARVSKTDKEIKKSTEESMFEIIDSVEDDPVQDTATPERPGRRRSARGKKEEEKIAQNLTETTVVEEKALYRILDSVEETIDDEPHVTRRSTRGKGEKNKMGDTPTRRRQTPARESQESKKGKSPKDQRREKPTNTVGETREDDATYKILDSVEDKVVKDERPTRGRKGQRGRPRKEIKTTKKDNLPLKSDASQEVTYQILDSVEDETGDDQPTPGKSESDRKEDISKSDDNPTNDSNSESMKTEEYQIVDSVEDEENQEWDTNLRQEERTTERERRRQRNKSRGGESGRTRKEEEQHEELSEVDTKELVTLDEVGADEYEEEREAESHERDEIAEEELQTLVTLDEVTEEDRKVKQSTPETLIQENKSVDLFNPETLVTLDEVGGEDEEKPNEDLPDETAGSKQRREIVGPEAKRSRSHSPFFDTDFKLPAFKPNNPLGQEFVVPTSGYFCNLCSVFYRNESNAKEIHCSSRRHYDNLQKHYQRLEQKPRKASSQKSCPTSD